MVMLETQDKGSVRIRILGNIDFDVSNQVERMLYQILVLLDWRGSLVLFLPPLFLLPDQWMFFLCPRLELAKTMKRDKPRRPRDMHP